MNEHSSFLKFDNISFGYTKHVNVLSGISFDIQNSNTNQLGHVTAIMGESGAGKSTILKLILGIEKPDQGIIVTYPEHPVISYVPQEAILFEHLTPMQNARYFEDIANYKSRFNSGLFSILVDILELGDVLKSKSVLDLSGGQRQRLSLLRALSIKPDFLLLDEPCTGLDAEVKIQFLWKLRQLVREYDLFVLYITHHHEEATIISDEVIYLSKNILTNCVSKITKAETLDFIDRTPTVDAAKVFHFPHLNIIAFDETTNSLLFTDPNCDHHSVTVKSDELHFNNESGQEFEIIAMSSIYMHVRLKNTGQMLICKNQSIQDLKYCSVNGNCNEYDSDGLYLKNLTISNNKIVIND